MYHAYGTDNTQHYYDSETPAAQGQDAIEINGSDTHQFVPLTIVTYSHTGAYTCTKV